MANVSRGSLPGGAGGALPSSRAGPFQLVDREQPSGGSRLASHLRLRQSSYNSFYPVIENVQSESAILRSSHLAFSYPHPYPPCPYPYPTPTPIHPIPIPTLSPALPTLSLPGLDIRTEPKGVVLSFFGLNLAVFILLFSAWTMWFWSILAEKHVLVEFWSNI